MRCAHHGSLIYGSVLITPFFEFEPAALHIDVLDTSCDRETCSYVLSYDGGKDQGRLPQGPESPFVPIGPR